MNPASQIPPTDGRCPHHPLGAGRPGLGLKAANEQAAVNQALGNCVKSDSDCHVIAIGPFSVGPN